MPIRYYPTKYMRGLAKADMPEIGEIWRNDGYGWGLLTATRASLRQRLNTPAPDDPVDASAAQAEFMEVHLPWDSIIRIGDQYRQDMKIWSIGLVNNEDSYKTYNRCYAARPVAATPIEIITIRRFDQATSQWFMLAPQAMQIAWSKNQPDRLGGVAVRQYGHIFAPEGYDDLDIKQGDTFDLYGMSANVTWVVPDPGQRREAIFSVNIGEGV